MSECCGGMEFALENPPRADMGIKWQLVVDTKTFAESYVLVYYMRRNQKKGDRVFKILYCPFCGKDVRQERLKEQL